MNLVYFIGGIVIALLALIAFFKEGASKQATTIALLSAAAFILAGVERSLSDALNGSLFFILWAIIAIPERLNKRVNH